MMCFKKILFLWMTIIVLNLFMMVCYASTTASFSITAQIGSMPVSIETDSGLNFGTIPADSSTPIKISPDAGGAASFVLKGVPGTAFTAFVSAAGGSSADTTVSLTKQTVGTGAATLKVDDFAFSGLDTSSETGGTGTINVSGENVLKFGATANPTGEEEAGAAYSGNMFLIVAEQ